MLTRLQGGLAAFVVLLGTGTLVALDLLDDRFRRWWAARALATDVLSGLLVLLLTLLVVDQLLRRRELGERERVVGAQGALLMAQATRAVGAIDSALTGASEHDAAADEVRTYLMMLLVVAPVLIDARASRAFLEQAQVLGGEMARALTAMRTTADASTISRERLDAAAARLHEASKPVLQVLDLEKFMAPG